MNIKVSNFVGNEEQLTTIFILDDNNAEIKRYSFYNTPREMEMEPELRESFNDLPNLLKMIYNSGRKNEQLDFSTETIFVD